MGGGTLTQKQSRRKENLKNGSIRRQGGNPE